MFRNALTTLVAGLLLTAGTAAHSFAEPGSDPNTTLVAAPAIDSASLTIEQIHSMLVQMGYQAELLPYGNGNHYVRLMVNGGSVDVEMSVDKMWLWMTVYLAPLPSDAPSDRLATLLGENDRIGLARYGLRHGHIALQIPIANKSLTAFDFRAAIDSIQTTANVARDKWDVTRWGGETQLSRR